VTDAGLMARTEGVGWHNLAQGMPQWVLVVASGKGSSNFGKADTQKTELGWALPFRKLIGA